MSNATAQLKMEFWIYHAGHTLTFEKDGLHTLEEAEKYIAKQPFGKKFVIVKVISGSVPPKAFQSKKLARKGKKAPAHAIRSAFAGG